jgi:uncharacterized protein (DUF111 family)
MKFIIDPSGGIAGDMFSAALISAGADTDIMKKVMKSAAEKLGTASIHFNQTSDGASQLTIELRSSRHHLSETEAAIHLQDLFREFRIEKKYRDFGFKILEILVKAEKKAHRTFNIVIHNHEQSREPRPSEISEPPIRPSQDEITFLHEAQDIIVDIVGAVSGLQLLKIPPMAILANPVSVGGGHIHFSHGSHEVPAPATRVILDDFRIRWEKGPIDKELCTPTGASILAALDSGSNVAPKEIPNRPPSLSGLSRGSRIYDIPPLRIDLY